MRKILIFTIILFACLNTLVIDVKAEENENFITAEDLIDNEYIENLLASLPATCDDTTSRYASRRLGDRYMTEDGETIDLSVITENVSNVVFTPNGTAVNDPTLSGALRIVGIFDTSEVSSILDRLNNGEQIIGTYLLDQRLVEDLKISNSGYFSNYVESYNYLRDASCSYNCHSYAWYSQSPSNQIWLGSPATYYSAEDQSYRQLESTETPTVGDIIVYMKDGEPIHSGIIVGYTGDTSSDGRGNANRYEVESKWGVGGLYRHNGDECPEYKTQFNSFYVTYYRLQSDAQVSAESGDFTVDLVENVAARNNSNVTSKEEQNFTCEVNMSESAEHTITVSAASELVVKLMNSSRELYDLSCTESIENGMYKYVYSGYFAEGTYHIRAEFAGDSDSGEITISVPHQHFYTYLPQGVTGHLCSCPCGHSYFAGHVAKAGAEGRFKPCAFCGYLIDTGSGIIVPGIKKTNFFEVVSK